MPQKRLSNSSQSPQPRNFMQQIQSWVFVLPPGKKKIIKPEADGQKDTERNNKVLGENHIRITCLIFELKWKLC